MIIEKTPAKLIFSGEHAVVYGAPALAVAINHHCLNTLAYFQKKHIISIESTSLNYQKSLNFKELHEHGIKIGSRYQDYLNGKIPIGMVLSAYDDLLLYTLYQVMNYLDNSQGIHFKIESTIPIGCGMGSSAAVIINLLNVCLKLTQEEMHPAELFTLAQQIENCQHGKSSGLDLHIIYHQSAIFLENRQYLPIKLPQGNYFGVNTGKPKSSTGECVTAVKEKMTRAKLDAFTSLAHDIKDSFLNADEKTLIPLIRRNHRLLIDIGVVPHKVQQFIAQVEQIGGAAKICGAGSITDDNAGYLLLLGEKDKLVALCNQYNYHLEALSW